MPELYSAAQGRAAHGDRARIRRLLLVVRTMLRVHSMLALNLWLGVQASSRDPQVQVFAEKFPTLQAELNTVLTTLETILAELSPGEPNQPGAGQPAAPSRRVHDPSTGDLRGLLAIPLVAGTTALTTAWVGGAAVVGLSRQWWRGFRKSNSADGGAQPTG